MSSSTLEKQSRLFVAGHRGLVGTAICRALARNGFAAPLTRARAELDLTDAAAVQSFFATEQPEFVILAAARVGGILANNTYPADFLRENLLIQMNVIEAARISGVRRLLFLGSSCIYPKLCPQPIREEYLLTGALEPTNRPYALAKISGIEMCWASNRQYGTQFIAAMPTNIYGPGDNFDPATSHVLPSLLRKAHIAKSRGDRSITLWGTGTPRRELLHSDDLAQASLHLLSLDEPRFRTLLQEERAPIVNIGTGEDVTIRELAEIVAETVGFEGDFEFDTTKPDGTPRKLLDVTRIHSLGWSHSIGLRDGIRSTYEQVRDNLDRHPPGE